MFKTVVEIDYKKIFLYYNHGNNEPHTHGAFTFHLIEGLGGKATDPDNGVVTIGSQKIH